jgi:N-methylhydantoinase B
MTENTGIDPVRLGILWDRLVSICDEIVEGLVRTSFSSIVREGYDV